MARRRVPQVRVRLLHANLGLITKPSLFAETPFCISCAPSVEIHLPHPANLPHTKFSTHATPLPAPTSTRVTNSKTCI